MANVTRHRDDIAAPSQRSPLPARIKPQQQPYGCQKTLEIRGSAPPYSFGSSEYLSVYPPAVRPYFWTPEQGLIDRAKTDRAPYDIWARQCFLMTTTGATVDYEVVARDMADILADLDVQAIAFDRWRIDIFKKDPERLGLE